MLAAVESGDAKELAELMRQDPGFNVNMAVHRDGWALLHYACRESRRSPIVPLLLAHPDIDVNVKSKHGQTPFLWACNGDLSCVREMLKDSRVKVNELDNDGWTPLWVAACWGHVDILKWLIASGREMDLGTSGDSKTDAIMEAQRRGRTDAVTLLERFKENPEKTRHAVRVELGVLDELAAEMFALVVFVSDGLLQVKNTTTTTARFFSVAGQLPLELQMVLCQLVVESGKEIIPCKESESAFKDLAKKLL